MILSIIVIVLTLIILMALHEFGHFIFAKLFKIPVDEFGIGYPPRIWGKKFGETIYSINWLPFGAFVKILGEDNETDSPNSFAKQAIWKRAIVLFAGVASFWIIAIVIFSFLSASGIPSAVDDNFVSPDAKVIIAAVGAGTPAEKAGLLSYDQILFVKGPDASSSQEKVVEKVSFLQEFVKNNKGKQITLIINRNNSKKEIQLIPRTEYGADEGAMGVALVRAVIVKFPWYEAPYRGIQITLQQTVRMALTLGDSVAKLFKGEKVSAVKFVGPIGVGSIMVQALGSGVGVYLSYVVLITIWMALFNLLPIPALDGGRLLFLAIEAIRKKPIAEQVEQKITGFFFLLLIGLMAIVTIKDIIGLF